MAHFAQLNESNNVVTVIVIDNSVIHDLPFPDSEPIGVDFCKTLYGNSTIWKQTSYNSNFRGKFASVDNKYIPELDIFVPGRPWSSWNLNLQTLEWEPPYQIPSANTTEFIYVWNENSTSWIQTPAPSRDD